MHTLSFENSDKKFNSYTRSLCAKTISNTLQTFWIPYGEWTAKWLCVYKEDQR